MRDVDIALRRACPGKPGAGNPHAGFHLGGEAQGRPRPLSTNHSIPHGVILNCLRKRIKDERFIDLVRQMLNAGVMEEGHVLPTYSGTPQGGLASPILSNVVLHACDGWLEGHWQANPPPLTAKQ